MSTRILVIEDNPTNMDLMTYLLRALGYEVECAQDGMAGLQLAKREHFDLILTDILMPELDGFEFARRFKSEAAFSKTPIVAVTALAMTGDRERIMTAGFDGYVSKPIDPRKFVGQIEAFLGKSGNGQSARH